MAPRKGIPPEYRPSVRNILTIWAQATADDLDAGAQWYPDAHKVAIDIAGDGDVGAGVLAALSPQRSWSDNVTGAREFMRTGRCRYATGRNISKAQSILDGGQWGAVLGGPKVRSFAACIADPWDTYAVVVDRHAFDIAVGRVTSDAERNLLLKRAGTYDRFARTYRAAARVLDDLPMVVQATTWTTWRRLKGLPD